MDNHAYFMGRALELAKLGGREVMPNPLVGAVLVRDNQIIAEGYHRRFGGSHAEVEAIKSVADSELFASSTLYVTLEPCSHFGKTPPCADLIIRSRIPRVVVGCEDPFSKVSGRGIARLRAAGVEVIESCLRDSCQAINKKFIVAHRLKRPYIILKWAQTSDGFIAPDRAELTWITGESAQALNHRWRSEEMAILVGTRTALIDDPRLTVRCVAPQREDIPELKNPVRVVVDRKGILPLSLNLFNDESETLVFSASSRTLTGSSRCIPLKSDLSIVENLCQGLYNESLLSVIVEGGAETIQSFLEAGAWEEARVFTAARQFGVGVKAPVFNHKPFGEYVVGADTLRRYAHPALAERVDVSPNLAGSAIISGI
jgi:diaminohydroxyphosphoribosylaminopyrimidine deaminase/5-amino-6-(5-phosphoribosylamino)uracil reductase